MQMISPFELETSWHKVLEEELQKPYLLELAAFLERERAAGQEIYPPKDLIFNAFRQTPFEKVKVVIMGQDPYHGAGQAHGLCFSVPKGITPPPSLKNIFKELNEDLKIPEPNHGCLLSWTKQGVLLLNAILTVRKGEPLSHKGKGWERFTDVVLYRLAERKEPVIFLLWGRSAQEKCEHILPLLKGGQHVILKAAHPSPFSVQGFFGCKHFSKTNHLLKERNQSPIDWQVS